jgi:hypothetical protein
MNRFLILILTIFPFSVTGFARNFPRIRTRQSDSSLNAFLRRAIIRELGNECSGELKFVSRQADLDGDGRLEILAWVPTDGCGGTSGYPLLIFRRGARGLRLVSDIDQLWTPLIVLRSSRNGWRDIVMQEGGGGVRMHYILLRHTGRRYTKIDRSSATSAMIRRGRVLIGRNWSATTFGPIPR